MPASRLVRRRQVLLRTLAPLRSSAESDRSVFWAITGLNALWLLVTVICDVLMNWQGIIDNPVEIVVSIVSGVLAVVWIAAALILKERFPKWAGALGFFFVIGALVAHLIFGDTPVFASTALHILPAIIMYLGWFWPPRHAWAMFLGSVIAIGVGIRLSPAVGQSAVLTPSIALYTLCIMGLAFILASYLRTNMKLAAHTDSLTQTLNSRGTQVRLASEFARSDRNQEPLTVVLVDLDGFKQLNDTYGHPYGDSILANSAGQWRTTVRSYDTIGRVGGDEFLFIFPRTTAGEALQVLNRLQMNAVHSWSWGLSEKREGDSVETLLERADARLYEKKQSRPRRPDGRLMTGPVDIAVHGGVKPPRKRLFRLPRQTSFSIMSATLGFFVLVPVTVGTLLNPPEVHGGLLWLTLSACVLSLVSIALPLWFGSRYPARACFWTAAVLLTFMVVSALLVESTTHGIALLYATSLVALYLGTFSGTKASRGLLISGLLLLGLPLLFESSLAGNAVEQRLIATAVIYGAIVYCILFELSSYLYSRSRAFVEHDSLTGALNRHGLAAYGFNELARAERAGYPLSAVMLDCINFKQVNDSGGHSAGNRVLKDVTQHFTANLGPEDIFVRLGGDEFFVLLPYLSVYEAEQKIRRILQTGPIGMHVGVTDFRPGDTVDTLIARADDVLFSTPS